MNTTDKNPNINSSGGGFYDIALEPRLLDWPDIAHAAIIELKYLKPGDPEPTPSRPQPPSPPSRPRPPSSWTGIPPIRRSSPNGG